MPWFTAHAITCFRFSDGREGDVPVWENVILVDAPDRDAAARMAEDASRDGEGSFGGLAEMGGRPGEVVFTGIRKVESVTTGDKKPSHGDEITHIELTLPDMVSVSALAKGEAVHVLCDRVVDARPGKVSDPDL